MGRVKSLAGGVMLGPSWVEIRPAAVQYLGKFRGHAALSVVASVVRVLCTNYNMYIHSTAQREMAVDVGCVATRLSVRRFDCIFPPFTTTYLLFCCLYVIVVSAICKSCFSWVEPL